MTHRRQTAATLASAALAAVLATTLAFAGPSAAPAGTSVAGGTPLLQQLSRETEHLYGQIRGGLVRVYLPPPKWALNLMGQDYTIKRWDLQLDPSVRDKLRGGEVPAGSQPKFLEATISASPSTQPSNPPSTQPAVGTTEARGFRLVPRGDGSFDLVAETGEDRAIIDVGPRSVGIVVDSEGHVLLPYFIEREAVGEQPLIVACGDGSTTTARFVGSDRQTLLTVLKLDTPPAAAPMALSGRRPGDGAMVMFLNLTGEYGRLQVWTGPQQDAAGVVVSVDGGVCGFQRQGQFLDAAKCGPVVQQLISEGRTRRPVLGVFLREVLPADPIRREHPALGMRPAVLVVKVLPNSPADRAGVREGDLIVALGDEAVGDPPSFAAAMTPVRGSTGLTVLRGEALQSLSVTFPPR